MWNLLVGRSESEASDESLRLFVGLDSSFRLAEGGTETSAAL